MSFNINKLLIKFFALLIILFNVSSAQAGDYDQIKLDLLLANRGDSGAQFYVAGAYEEGRGVKKDLKLAFEWFRKAADNKHNGAQYKLGEFYSNGWGTSKDLDKASYWYKEAEKNGSQLAKIRVTELESGKKAEKSKLAKENTKRLNEEKLKKKLAEDKARKIKKKSELAAAKAKKDKKVRQRKELLKKQQAQKAQKDKKEKQLKLAKIQKASRATPKISLHAGKSKKVSKQPATKIRVSEMINSILLGKWKDQNGAASVLPSSANNCLKASDIEVICFSTEQQRVVASSELIFTTKSTLTNFKTNGQFQIKYYYNVLNLAAAAGKGASVDPSGLRTEKGWQEPQQVMTCRYLNKARLACVKGKYKLNFRI